MTIQQHKYFFELCTLLGYSTEELKERAKLKYHKQHFGEISSAEIAPLIGILEDELKQRMPEEKAEKTLPDFPNDFRVFDKLTNTMLYNKDALYVIDFQTLDEQNYHVMQYTGRQDDQGEKIYDFDCFESQLKKKYLVQWSWGDCAWVGFDTETNERILLRSFGKLTKIGNIYTEIGEEVREE